MAEELDGLEGIGDLDDEFGDQLDSFMDSEGGDDGELDSFFEDLSTIDDLSVGSPLPGEYPPAIYPKSLLPVADT